MTKPPNAARGGKREDGTTWTSGEPGNANDVGCATTVLKAATVAAAFLYGLWTRT